METAQAAGYPIAALQLARPINLAIVAIGVVVGALVAAGPQLPLQSTSLAVVVAVLATAGGNTLNDYFDRYLDRAVHPQRPLPSGRFPARSAPYLAGGEFALAMTLALFINPAALLLTLLNGSMMIGYEVALKRRGLVGNAAISYLVGSVFLFGALATAPDRAANASILFLLAFLANLAREVVKDVEDLAGDAGSRVTLPMVAGRSEALAFAALCLLLAVLLSPAPLWFGIGGGYVIPVLVADATFMVAISSMTKSPTISSKFIKAGMLIALVAFIMGVMG